MTTQQQQQLFCNALSDLNGWFGYAQGWSGNHCWDKDIQICNEDKHMLICKAVTKETFINSYGNKQRLVDCHWNGERLTLEWSDEAAEIMNLDCDLCEQEEEHWVEMAYDFEDEADEDLAHNFFS